MCAAIFCHFQVDSDSFLKNNYKYNVYISLQVVCLDITPIALACYTRSMLLYDFNDIHCS